MEKIIELNVKSIDDIVDKFNNNKISNECLEYLITSSYLIKRNEEIKLIVENCDVDVIKKLIVNSLKDEYNKSVKIIYINNINQLICTLIGIIFLIFSTFVSDNFIFKELLIIIGWVPIWRVIEIELFNDTKEMRKRKILKKLLNMKITERL